MYVAHPCQSVLKALLCQSTFSTKRIKRDCWCIPKEAKDREIVALGGSFTDGPLAVSPAPKRAKLTAFKTAPEALKRHVGSQPLRVSFEEPLAETTTTIVAPREGELAKANIISHDVAIGSSASTLPIVEGKLSTQVENSSVPIFEPAAREG